MNKTVLGFVDKRGVLDAKVESLSKEYYHMRNSHKSTLWNWLDYPATDDDSLLMTQRLKYLCVLN